MTVQAVQIAYDRVLEDGLPGSVTEGNPRVTEAYVAEQDIPYGVVVSKGSPVQSTATQTGRLAGAGAITATAGYVIGTGALADLADLNLITDGQFAITINGTAYEVTACDFSAATDYDGVATVLQTRLAVALIGTLCVYDSDLGQFKITSPTTGIASTVSDASEGAGAGTDIFEVIALDSGDNVDGLATQTLAVIGVNQRTLISESTSIADSGTVSTKTNEIGAVLVEGRIKVLCLDGAADRGAVYYDDTTGEIYGAAGAGRTQLGTAIFRGAVAAGKVGTIDVTGLRGA